MFPLLPPLKKKPSQHIPVSRPWQRTQWRLLPSLVSSLPAATQHGPWASRSSLQRVRVAPNKVHCEMQPPRTAHLLPALSSSPSRSGRAHTRHRAWTSRPRPGFAGWPLVSQWCRLHPEQHPRSESTVQRGATINAITKQLQIGQ